MDQNELEQLVDWLDLYCESAIEVALGAQLIQKLHPPFKVFPQFGFYQYRYDFAILKLIKPCLLIECDGAEFHSNRRQNIIDKKKDEIAKVNNIPIIRFSGQRVYKDAVGCAEKVMSLIGVRLPA